ncbi:MAG: GNAT family N-acetyltransferase, partial [Opitutaceae bacterium]|nr:GNAT family N-acetyltransferase [Verrucomicrobiales bacterium]
EAAAFLAPILLQARDFHRRIGSRAPWYGYLGVEAEGNRIVGVCSFKGNPDRAGEVEISYGTMPALEGRGFATEMAKALVKIAFESSEVRMVISHTLPESNASGRVLTKTGFTLAGEVIDPEDGQVWRWEITRPTDQ